MGFGFIQSEKEPFYRFILRDLHDIYRQLNLPDPRVVLTDKEKVAIEAEVHAVYLARQQEYSREGQSLPPQRYSFIQR